jgi:hypothetical protein
MANYNLKQFCPVGHDTFIVGRTRDHRCKPCYLVRQTKYRKANPEKIRAIGHKYEIANKDKIADSKLRSKYGITLVQKQTIFALQNGKCATCPFIFESVSSAHVDHCHNTGRVRGLLCSSCNLVAGKAKDSPAILRSIADYLEKNA